MSRKIKREVSKEPDYYGEPLWYKALPWIDIQKEIPKLLTALRQADMKCQCGACKERREAMKNSLI